MIVIGFRKWMVWACLALATFAATPAEAQSSYVDDRYPHLFAPRDQRPRIIRIPQGSRNVTPRVARPAESLRPQREQAAAPTATDSAEAVAPAAPTTFVLVMGDNLAEWLAYGLEEAFEDVPELGVVDKTRLSSGLTRPEFHDWVRAVPETLAAQEKVDFIVMMLGANDRQAIRIEREAIDPENERWRGLYAERVGQIMQAMKTRGVPVYWVGVPPLRGQRTSAHMQMLNAIYKEQAEKNGVNFVDVWNGFIDEHGNYTQFGPDFAGQVRRLRTADGVHFTVAGARKLALFLEQDLRRDLLGRITPALPSGADPAGLPQADLPGAPLPVAPRPAAGPVLTLHGTPTLPAGAAP
ncbi:MAG: SGNH family hydrolase, partial [Phreatobacter sp.]|uniref:SGNH/GDSL hydrolase family protein n=1 Tax=Phreatobacter sp. TaxID=1966341 RepID=UPI0027324FC1